jgi:hypothetical protein
MSWKRRLALAPLLIVLFLAGVAEFGSPAFSAASKRLLIAALEDSLAALQDPLSLFAERSPGGRRAGALLSTKSKPHERVLSTVRERETPVEMPDDGPVTSLAFASVPIAAPEYDSPHDQSVASLFFPPFFPNTPPGYSGFLPGAPPTATPPTPETPTPPPESPPLSPPVTIVLPEPASWTVMILGLIAIAARRRVRKRQTNSTSVG